MRPPVRLAALLVLVAGCRSEPGDSGEPCEGCFAPVQIMWSLSTGLRDGAFAAVTTLGGERAPTVTFTLAGEDYPETLDPADACAMTYDVVASAGASEPEGWADWLLALEPRETDCETLDPRAWGEDPMARLPERAWEIVLEPLAADMEDRLQGWFEAEGDDWALDGDPYYFGSHTWIDGRDSAGDYGQTHFGRAFEVDDTMAVVDEADGGHLVPVEEVQAGADGFYEVFSAYYFQL